jgi:hypothetical protein
MQRGMPHHRGFAFGRAMGAKDGCGHSAVDGSWCEGGMMRAIVRDIRATEREEEEATGGAAFRAEQKTG